MAGVSPAAAVAASHAGGRHDPLARTPSPPHARSSTMQSHVGHRGAHVGSLPVTRSLTDFVRMSSIILEKAKQGTPLATIAYAVEQQPDVRRARDLQVYDTSSPLRQPHSDTSSALRASRSEASLPGQRSTDLSIVADDSWVSQVRQSLARGHGRTPVAANVGRHFVLSPSAPSSVSSTLRAAREDVHAAAASTGATAVAAAVIHSEEPASAAVSSAGGARRRHERRFLAPLASKQPPVLHPEQQRWGYRNYVVAKEGEAGLTPVLATQEELPDHNPALLHPPSSIKRDFTALCVVPPPSPDSEKEQISTLDALRKRLSVLPRAAALPPSAAIADDDADILPASSSSTTRTSTAASSTARSASPVKRNGTLWQLHDTQRSLHRAALVHASQTQARIRAAQEPRASNAGKVSGAFSFDPVPAPKRRGRGSAAPRVASAVGSTQDSTRPTPVTGVHTPQPATRTRVQFQSHARRPSAAVEGHVVDAQLQRHRDLLQIRYTLQQSNQISSLIRSKRVGKPAAPSRSASPLTTASGNRPAPSTRRSLSTASTSSDDASSGSGEAGGDTGPSALRRVVAKYKNRKSRPTFHASGTVQVFYGSIVAFESLDGWFLTVHPKSGIVTVREPEAHWAERGLMPFRQRTLATGIVEEPVYLFRLVHLRTPGANGPIRHGDPVWLQVVQGRGDDGWRTGSVLAPYMHTAIEMESRPVDVMGHPLGWAANQMSMAADAARGAAARAAATGTLVQTGAEAAAAAVAHITRAPLADSLAEDADTRARNLAQDRSMRSLVSMRAGDLSPPTRKHVDFIATVGNPAAIQLQSAAAAAVAAAVAVAPSNSNETQDEGTFLTSLGISSADITAAATGIDTPRGDAAKRRRASISESLKGVHPSSELSRAIAAALGEDGLGGNRRGGAKSQGPAAGGVLAVASPLDAEGFVANLQHEIIVRARMNPLDRVHGRIGVPRPIVAHTPVPGSALDYLYGPITAGNRTGLYRRADAGYDVLYDMANARPLVAGKWRVQGALKEITADGLVIGGMGIEGPATNMHTMEAAASGTHPSILKASARTARLRKGTLVGADGRSGSPLKSRKGEIANIAHAAAQATAIDAEDAKKALRKDVDDREFLMNLNIIYLEQEWFYISCAAATAAGDASDMALAGFKSPPKVLDSSASAAPRVTFANKSSTHAEPEERPRAVEEHGGGMDGAASESHTSISLPPALESLPAAAASSAPAADGCTSVKQPMDGCSGGNRREAFLSPHTSNHAGTYKVEKRGVFRIRVLQHMDGGNSVNAARDDELAVKARSQLRVSEKGRLGKAASQRGTLAAAAAGYVVPPPPPDAMIVNGDMVFREDDTAAVNLARRMRAQMHEAEDDARARFLTHEEMKFSSLGTFYDGMLARHAHEMAGDAADIERAAQYAQHAMEAQLALQHAIAGGVEAVAAGGSNVSSRARAARLVSAPASSVVMPAGSYSHPPGASASTSSQAAPTAGGVAAAYRRQVKHARGVNVGESRWTDDDAPIAHGEHTHVHGVECQLCRGKGGAPIFAVNLCAADEAVERAIRADARVNHLSHELGVMETEAAGPAGFFGHSPRRTSMVPKRVSVAGTPSTPVHAAPGATRSGGAARRPSIMDIMSTRRALDEAAAAAAAAALSMVASPRSRSRGGSGGAHTPISRGYQSARGGAEETALPPWSFESRFQDASGFTRVLNSEDANLGDIVAHRRARNIATPATAITRHMAERNA